MGQAGQYSLSDLQAAPQQTGRYSLEDVQPQANTPSQDWIQRNYGYKSDSSPQQAIDRYNNRNFVQKAIDFGIQHTVDPFVSHTENAIDAAKTGQYAKMTNEGVKAATPIALATLPEAVAARPLATLAGVGTGVVGGAAASGIAKKVGASDDQAELSGNIAGILTGMAGSNAPKALPLVGKAATKITDSVDPDLLGLFSPRAAAGLKWISKAGKVVNKLNGADSGGLAEIVQPHTEKITELSQQLADALSRANALPPEGPTATLKDVPDLRVQPSQQPPQNLLTKPAAAPAAQVQPQGGTFEVVPPEGAPKGKVTPNMEIYNEPDIPRTPPKPPTLLEQLREWDNIRKIHAQLEDQIGKGQDEVQQWMEDHNQQAPGGKKLSGAQATAKARFDAAKAKASGIVPAAASAPVPKVPESDAEMENLLMQSLQMVKNKKSASARAGGDD